MIFLETFLKKEKGGLRSWCSDGVVLVSGSRAFAAPLISVKLFGLGHFWKQSSKSVMKWLFGSADTKWSCHLCVLLLPEGDSAWQEHFKEQESCQLRSAEGGWEGKPWLCVGRTAWNCVGAEDVCERGEQTSVSSVVTWVWSSGVPRKCLLAAVILINQKYCKVHVLRQKTQHTRNVCLLPNAPVININYWYLDLVFLVQVSWALEVCAAAAGVPGSIRSLLGVRNISDPRSCCRNTWK